MPRGFDNAAFKRQLARIPEKMRRAVNEANRQNAEEWVRLSKSLVPRDPKDGTPLHDSIRNHETETGGQVVRAGGKETTKPVKSGGEFDYALAQEFGTLDMPANPFFWPAYRALKKRFNRRCKAALRKVAKEFGRG